MDQTNVLVTGSNSQLALTLKDIIKTSSYPIDFVFKDRLGLDISDQNSIKAAFEENTYSYCLNCAAYTDVEGAESNREMANAINSEAVENLAKACFEKDIILIHISTDYVFDGDANRPYNEDSETNPINEYGKSKLRGENNIRKLMERYFIIRTSWLYSAYGKNFVKTIISNLKLNNPLNVIDSQIGTPTSCVDLGNFIIHLITSKSSQFGTYHFSALGKTSWFGFAKQIAGHFKNYDMNNLKPINNYPTKAKRPLYSVLDVTKASQLYPLNAWQNSVDYITLKILEKSN